jgi:transposase
VRRYHAHARLTARGRAALLSTVRQGARVTAACAAAGVSRTTYYRGRRRFAAEGAAGLADRPSRPHAPRRRLTPDQERAVARGREPERCAPGPVQRGGAPSGSGDRPARRPVR